MDDVLRNSERGPGPFVSSTAPRAELPPWAATLQWWWRCRLSKWVFRCAYHIELQSDISARTELTPWAATLQLW